MPTLITPPRSELGHSHEEQPSEARAAFTTVVRMESTDGDGKATFDHIYDQPDPHEFYRTLQALDYEIPQHAYPKFATLLDGRESAPATILDVCCSYGVNAALLRCELTLDDLFRRYADNTLDQLSPAELVAADRQFYAGHQRAHAPRVFGLDLAANAIGYARDVGLLADGWAENLETNDPSPELVAAIRQVDLITITGGVGYVTERTFDRLMSVVGEGRKPMVAAFVLRRYSYAPIAQVLAQHGLVTEGEQGRTYPQRRFTTQGEQDAVLQSLAASGIDAAGKEADGRYHAEFFLSTPVGQSLRRRRDDAPAPP